jgi:biotin transporter BioY
MGTGGITALGCSIGQRLAAFSTLAYSAPVVLLCVLAGAVLGLRHLVKGAG